MNPEEMLGTVSSFVALDWVILGIATILLASICLRSGVSKANGIVLSVPMAAWLFELMPKAMLIGEFYASIQASGMLWLLFAALFVGSYLIIDRLFFSFGGLYGGLSHALMAGAAGTIVLAVSFMAFPVLSGVWAFSYPVSEIFSVSYAFYWIIAALGMLAFVSS